MKIILRKWARLEGHIEVVEVDGDPDKVPSKRTFESPEDAIRIVALYLGVRPEDFDEVTYQE